jgi:hypothetical protein
MAPLNSWIELTPRLIDRTALDNAFTLLRQTYPTGQYDNLRDVDRIRRKMVEREGLKLLRVFHRSPLVPDKYMAAFFFKRRASAINNYPRAYCLTLAVGESVPEATITTQAGVVCEYMKNQPGGDVLVILDRVDSSPPPEPPPRYPVTLRPDLSAAFKNAVEITHKIAYCRVIPADPRPWPHECYAWLLSI